MFSILIVGLFAVQLASADPKARPILQEILVPKNLKEYQTFRLLCALIQGESVEFEWFHDGKKMIDNQKKKLRFNGDSSELLIKSISVDDLGEVKCLARNEYGDDIQIVRLMMNVKPQWTVEPEDHVTGTLSQELSLDCNAKAYPPATVFWMKLDENKQMMIKKYESNNIKFLLSGETAGFYKCLGTNQLGSIEKIVKVEYHGKSIGMNVQKSR